MKTIGIPEELHKELVKLKLELGDRNTAELIKKLVFSFREKRFLEASRFFRKRMDEKKITFSELLKRSEKIKEEISNEWFS